jgi:hypothetical protein
MVVAGMEACSEMAAGTANGPCTAQWPPPLAHTFFSAICIAATVTLWLA